MKRLVKITGVLCAAALTAALSFTSLAESGAEKAADTILFKGTVVSVEDGRFVMNHQKEDFSEEVIINMPEDMKILDAVNGYPIPVENLEAGEPIYVYVGQAMTMSLPPMTNGVLALADIPADFAVPSYITIESLRVNAAADGESYVLTGADGSVYEVNGSTTLLPYLTRNMVTVQNLVPGAEILLWSDGSQATKIVIFPGENGYGSADSEAAKYGWEETEEGWYFYEYGEAKKGWLFDNGDWYYFNPETGIMENGFLTIGDKTYFLRKDGRMLNEAATFVPDENGVLHLGE